MSSSSFRQWTTGERICHSILRGVGLLSFLAAICVLGETSSEIYSGTTIPRIVFLAMVGSSLLSSMYFVGTTTMPRDEGAWGAMGTVATCDATGFLNNFGNLIFTFYDMFLSITYVLVVRYNWNDKRLVILERIVHPTVWLLTIIVSVSALATESFGADWDSCWITARECNSTVNCDQRGSKGRMFLIALFLFQLVMVVVSVVCMLTIYYTVKANQQRSMRYSIRWRDETAVDEGMFQNNTSSSRSMQENGSVRRGLGLVNGSGSKVKEVGIQGMFYAGTTLACFLPATIFVAIYANSPRVSDWVRNNFWGSLISYIMLYLYGMHGVFYLYVYMRRRPRPKTAYGRFWRRILFRSSCCNKKDQGQTPPVAASNNITLPITPTVEADVSSFFVGDNNGSIPDIRENEVPRLTQEC